MATTTNALRCPCGAHEGDICKSATCLRLRGPYVWSKPSRTVSHGGHQHNLTAAAAIAEGSVVRFKSGGPRMTVEDLRPDGGASVVWFAGSDEAGWQLNRQATAVSALELAAD